MVTIKSIYEFLLWDNCNNNCKFCFQRKNPRIFSLQDQNNILQSTLDFLNSDRYLDASHILLVGGELFDNVARYEMFNRFFAEIINMMLSNKIDLLYLNTNLCYDKACIDMLRSILSQFSKHNLFDRLKFTTSYDIEGRFSDISKRNRFLENLDLITDEFAKLNVVSNIILSYQCCNSILDNTFDIFSYAETHNTAVNLIPYIILDDSLTAKRSMIFKVIEKLYLEQPSYIQSWIQNLDLKQPRKLLQYKNNTWNHCECHNSSCGHSVNFKRYSTANSCFVCDIKEVFNSLC